MDADVLIPIYDIEKDASCSIEFLTSVPELKTLSVASADPISSTLILVGTENVSPSES